MKRRVVESMSEDVDVRVKAIKPLKGEVVIQSASDGERKALLITLATLARGCERRSPGP